MSQATTTKGKKQTNGQAVSREWQRYLLTGAGLGLYFGLFFRPLRDAPSLGLVLGLSLLSALLMTLLQLRNAQQRSLRLLLPYALRTWIAFAFIMAVLEGRHLVHDFGGRAATTIFTTLSGAVGGLVYAWRKGS
jgi:membrane associated rhomboid family serine protease